MSGEAQTGVNLAQLSTEQLAQLKKQTDEEVAHLTQSYASLKTASARFAESKRCIQTLKKEKDGKELLMPLTSSLYVPAELCETDSLLVDVGTGYYIKKSLNGAEKTLNRKADFVQQNLDKLEALITQKRKLSETLVFFMRQRFAAQHEAAAQQ
eukprot:CAMPEP_0113879920 /NCGR_PEP_ID=MMETSP0780_2-20120614/7499_1 /TAXON_ID=652834 /ORGANISM="Palpitomonas bilix" /LENGTH=153 /DNA_ID=CAMNT_0000866541 /DNA_START=160 /DNA_END=621 /DNA_ORIENTATION=+ /assembly_acc=CAM_ASM_000599